MITKLDLLKLIIEETMILLSAIEAMDMDLIQTSIERRGTLINELTLVEIRGDEEELTALISDYVELDKKSLNLMKVMMNSLSEERQKNVAQMHEARNKKNAHEKYTYFELGE